MTGFFSGIWNGITEIFGAVGSWFSNIFKGAYRGITDAFSGISNFFKGIWDGATSGVKEAINFILRGINMVISGVNKIHFDIPSWVPLIGGKSFGISIPEIPYLAQGGIINQATLAMIGEAGREAVVPLEHNLQWMKELAAQLVKAFKSAIPTFDTGLQARMALEAAYGGGYPVSDNTSHSFEDGTSGKPAARTGGVNVYQYFQGKTPSPAEHARQTRNSIKQALLEIRKK